MERVLMLGGSQHLRTVPVEEFGSPISHCNGIQPPEQYHRAVFFIPSDGDVAQVWYVYVTNEYQTSQGQLTSAEILQALESEGIGAHIESTPSANLEHERHVP